MSETKIKITIEAPESFKLEASRLADIVCAAHGGDIDVHYQPPMAERDAAFERKAKEILSRILNTGSQTQTQEQQAAEFNRRMKPRTFPDLSNMHRFMVYGVNFGNGESKTVKKVVAPPQAHQGQTKQEERDEIRSTTLLDLIEIDQTVADYFNRNYPAAIPEHLERLANDIYILRAIKDYIDLSEALPEGFSWADIAVQVKELSAHFPNHLPIGKKRIRALFIRFTREGIQAAHSYWADSIITDPSEY